MKIVRYGSKTNEAIAAYRKAIELDPRDAAPHSELAFCLRKQGKTRGRRGPKGQRTWRQKPRLKFPHFWAIFYGAPGPIGRA